MRPTLALVAVLIAMPAWGQADPTQSPACRAALDALQAAEAASAPAATARARLAEPRRRAARACLGGSAASSPAPRTARPPIVVAPVRVPAPAVPPPPARAPEPVAAPRPIGPPTVVLDCDATSCRASDGSVLQRAGSGLIGPRGHCRIEGNLLVCP